MANLTVSPSDTRRLFATTAFSLPFYRFSPDGWFSHPTFGRGLDLAHKHLSPRFQTLEKTSGVAVQRIERPGTDADTVGQREIDLGPRDLEILSEVVACD